MQMQTRIGGVAFTHDDEYRRDVEISKGDVMIKVPMEALRQLVAESIRHETLASIAKAKPETFLKRIA
jgi:hypothetical protein